MPDSNNSEMLLNTILQEIKSIGLKQDSMSKRLSNIESNQNVSASKVKHIEEDLRAHDQFINGNGSTGAKTRLISLEQTDNTQKKVFWLAASALIALVIKNIYDFFESLSSGAIH